MSIKITRLKHLARMLSVPVVVTTQVAYGTDKNDPPTLQQLRGSGDIEAVADTILLLHKDTNAANDLCISVAKNRNAPTGTVVLHDFFNFLGK